MTVASATLLVPLTEPERVLAASSLLYTAATTQVDVEEYQALATRLIEAGGCSCPTRPGGRVIRNLNCPQHGDGLGFAA